MFNSPRFCFVAAVSLVIIVANAIVIWLFPAREQQITQTTGGLVALVVIIALCVALIGAILAMVITMTYQPINVAIYRLNRRRYGERTAQRMRNHSRAKMTTLKKRGHPVLRALFSLVSDDQIQTA